MTKCSIDDRIWLSWKSPISDNFNEVVGGTIKDHYYLNNEEFEGVCFNIVWDKFVKDHFQYSKTLEPASEIGKTLFFSEEDAEENLNG